MEQQLLMVVILPSGANNNFSLYTENGGVRFSDLATGLEITAQMVVADEDGDLSTQPVPSNLPTGTINQTLRHNGTTWVKFFNIKYIGFSFDKWNCISW